MILLSPIVNDALGRVVELAREAPWSAAEITPEGVVFAYVYDDRIRFTVNFKGRSVIRGEVPISPPTAPPKEREGK